MMLSKNNPILRDQLEMVALDQLVPNDHLVRKMEASLDFPFIYDMVNEVYSEGGRPSIDPVSLIKLTLIQYTFGIPNPFCLQAERATQKLLSFILCKLCVRTESFMIKLKRLSFLMLEGSCFNKTGPFVS